MNDIFEKYRKQKKDESKPKLILKITIILLAIIFLTLTAVNLFRYSGVYREKKEEKANLLKPFPFELKSGDLLVTVIDVGQGDAILIETPNGKNMLIDCGSAVSEENRFDEKKAEGAANVIPFLKRRNVNQIDIAIGTHPAGEHIGGFEALIEKFPVKNYYECGFNFNSEIYKNLKAALKRKNIPVNIVKTGDEINIGADVYCKALYSNSNPDNVNNSSIVIYLQYKNTKFIFPGDIEKNRELEICSNYGNKLKANFLKVSNHGAEESTGKHWLKYVSPEIAVISAGKDLSPKYPNPEVVKRLKSNNCKTISASANGNIYVISDGNALRIFTDKKFKETSDEN
ncbi:MAG TPA: MBL fold metallo-hydrolase [bacterium]|nr:MBL fold metallo-hydrolase [bacterium]HPN29694.1 MBL fold metallo-hydrolase [bacterium]